MPLILRVDKGAETEVKKTDEDEESELRHGLDSDAAEG